MSPVSNTPQRSSLVAGAAPTGATRFPWYLAAIFAAVVSSAIGGPWDISWHLTIGRDTFWTPAHIAIYLGGASAGLICGWLAIRTTYLASDAERRAAVVVWGGRAPFGAWLVIWGAIAMLTAGPFDDWWHNAYGLDVKIISPPHVVLFLGGVAVRYGAWLLVLRHQNRTGSPGAAWLFAIMGGLLLQEISVLFMVEFFPNRQHGAEYFFIAAATFPFLLAAIGRAATLRCALTIAAATYMLFVALLIWILPLFAAEPRLGPIYHQVSHMVPPPFPQWLIVPAFALDLLRSRIALRGGWREDILGAVVIAIVFLALFLPAQWEFARFYLSPAADNAFFGGNRYWGYTSPAAGTPRLVEFWSNDAWTPLSVMRAFVAAVVSAWLGRAFGNWMREVKR